MQRRRTITTCCAVLAALAAIVSVERVSVVPLGLTPRAVAISAAHTSVIVDTPNPIVLDLRQNTYSFQQLQDRALLLGNVIGTPQVRDYVAARLNVPASSIQVTTPATPAVPLPAVDPGHARKVTDIAHLGPQYRLNIEADPTVPILDIYAEAPNPRDAVVLANSAVTGLRAYMSSLASSLKVPAADQVRLTQLGTAQGGVTNPGVNLQLSVLVFLIAFGILYGLTALLRVAPARRVEVVPEG